MIYHILLSSITILISILSNPSKIMESVSYSSLLCSVQRRLSKIQNDLLSARFFIINFATITQFLSNKLDNCSEVKVIYIDFSSVFNVINHNILLEKLNWFSLCWLFLKLLHSSAVWDLLFYSIHKQFTRIAHLSSSSMYWSSEDVYEDIANA